MIHSASPKDLLICVISKIIKVKLIVLSMSGLGYLFTNKNRITSYKANYFY